LSPHRTDLVTILHSLSTDSSTAMDGAGFTAQAADLGLDKSGSLAGALHAFEVTIDYP